MISVEEAYELLKEKFTSPEDPNHLYWWGNKDCKVFLIVVYEFRNVFLFLFQKKSQLGTDCISNGAILINRDNKEIETHDPLEFIFDDDYSNSKRIKAHQIKNSFENSINPITVYRNLKEDNEDKYILMTFLEGSDYYIFDENTTGNYDYAPGISWAVSKKDGTVQIWTNELKNEYIKKYTDIKQRRLGDF